LAQDQLIDNRDSSSRNRQYDYLLSQLLVCCEPWSHTAVYHADGARLGRNIKTPGICGRNFCGRIVKKSPSKQYIYYVCTRANAHADDCSARPIRGNDVEDAVWKLVAEAQRYPDKFIEETLREIDHTQLIRNLRLEITGIIDHLAHLDGERQVVLRQEQKRQLTEAEADTRMAEIASEADPLRDHKRVLELQLHSASLSVSELKRAGITSADVIEQLDRIEALCASKDAAKMSVGRQRKAAVIRSTVERIEVRTGAQGESRLQVFLRFGRELSIDLRASNTGDNNQQPADQTGLPRVVSQTADSQQNSLVTREIVLDRPRMGGGASRTA
jgi:hypothetical protein